MWHSEIVEGPLSGSPAEVALDRLTAQGWIINHVLTNGVNRWTIVCRKE